RGWHFPGAGRNFEELWIGLSRNQRHQSFFTDFSSSEAPGVFHRGATIIESKPLGNTTPDDLRRTIAGDCLFTDQILGLGSDRLTGQRGETFGFWVTLPLGRSQILSPYR